MAAGGCVRLAPDRGERRGDAGQGAGQGIRCRDRPALDTVGRGVVALDVQRQRIDAGRIGQHQDFEVTAVRRLDFRGRHGGVAWHQFGHAPPGRAQPAGPDQQQRRRARAEPRRQMAGDDTAK